MFKLTQIFIRSFKSTGRIPYSIRLNTLSSTVAVDVKPIQNSQSVDNMPVTNKNKGEQYSQKGMVAAAFASLKSEQNMDSVENIVTPKTDEKVNNATTVDALLSISSGSGVSRKHALKVVSILAEWTSSGKVSLADFENDPRFIKLCKILTKVPSKAGVARAKKHEVQSDDLSTVLNITADDEAAKLVASLTLRQMVKVLSTLTIRRRRSVPLLRALSYNICASQDTLNLKQSSDLLYSISTLNFYDENLLRKVSSDIITKLASENLDKSSVIGSIITSIGFLRYKDTELMDSLSNWVVKNQAMCRPQDIFSLFMTLAIINYVPVNSDILFKALIPQLTPSEAGSATSWVEIVWSLVLLNQATPEHISSVLNDDFIGGLIKNDLTFSTKLKLLNINGAAQYLIDGYSGPKLPENPAFRDVEIVLTKEKIEFVDGVIDTLRNLIQSENLLRTKFDTGFGFSIDVECVLDKKCNVLPLSSDLPADARRVVFITYDYHDMCRGKVEPSGINILREKILESQGYKVITVPYSEFNLRDKVVHRVKFLENKMKELCKIF